MRSEIERHIMVFYNNGVGEPRSNKGREECRGGREVV